MFASEVWLHHEVAMRGNLRITLVTKPPVSPLGSKAKTAHLKNEPLVACLFQQGDQFTELLALLFAVAR
jgi:hypothetical protein